MERPLMVAARQSEELYKAGFGVFGFHYSAVTEVTYKLSTNKTSADHFTKFPLMSDRAKNPKTYMSNLQASVSWVSVDAFDFASRMNGQLLQTWQIGPKESPPFLKKKKECWVGFAKLWLNTMSVLQRQVTKMVMFGPDNTFTTTNPLQLVEG